MRDLVVDTSSVVAVITDEPSKAALIEQTRGTRLFAPRSLHWEIGNAFSAMLKRKRIQSASATTAIQVYQQIPIVFVDVALTRALEISNQLGIYDYDAYMIACAQAKQCPLLSLDGGLLSAARSAGVDVIEVRA